MPDFKDEDQVKLEHAISAHWHSVFVPVSLCLSQGVPLTRVGAALAAQPLLDNAGLLAFRGGGGLRSLPAPGPRVVPPLRLSVANRGPARGLEAAANGLTVIIIIMPAPSRLRAQVGAGLKIRPGVHHWHDGITRVPDFKIYPA